MPRALLPDGTFFVSDEYGPTFAVSRRMASCSASAAQALARRNTGIRFRPAPPPASPPFTQPARCRPRKQPGAEGLSVSADGRTLYALMQSATRQDGGSGGSGQRRHTPNRYDITNPAVPT